MDTFWLSCLGYFEKELSAQQFNTWIKPLYLDLSQDASEPVLVAPNRFVLQWVKDNFLARIEQMAEKYFSQTSAFSSCLPSRFRQTSGFTGGKCNCCRNANSSCC